VDECKPLAVGMDDYVTKPVKFQLMLDVISKWISRSLHRDALHRDALVGRCRLKPAEPRV
jgi:DNA-binding response OmpR family regulator